MSITYGSVCSGIESASIAWESLGWKPAWFSQFDPEHNYSRQPDFPSRVLTHHWPHVPNLGDMTKIADLVRWGAIEAPDVLVGGTPCQAFSVAGLRKGLSDPRGQLTISFGELADAIDEQREKPCTIIWENVPGVLNSNDNAFGCFLALLAGESCELQPSGRKWTNAGCVSGPKRVVAWRVLDAQYFGVAQRRRRVFVVASADPDFDPTAVLFESDSLRRNTPPSRETGSQVAALTANGVGTCGADDNQAQGGHLIAAMRESGQGFWKEDDIAGTLRAEGENRPSRPSCVLAFGGGNTTGQIDVATTCTAHGNRQDFDTETFAVQSVNGSVTHTLTAEGHDASEDGTGRGTPVVAFNWAAAGNTSSDLGMNADYTGTLQASTHPAICYPINTQLALRGSETSNSSREGIGLGNEGDPSFTLLAAHHHAVATDMQVRRLMPVECERLQGFPDGHTDIPGAKDGPRYKALGNSMAVPVMRWLGRKISPR